MRRTHFGTVALAAVSMLIATPAMASPSAPPQPTTTVVSSEVAAPFNLEVSGKQVYVADGAMNLVGKVARNGSITPVATDQPGASGVALSRNGRTLAFATTVTDEGTFVNTESGLNIWGPRGKRIYADTLAFEEANNPDGAIQYGVENPSQCVSDALTAAEVPVSYTGGIDSHAYAVAAYRNGWLVADAGANVLWHVDRHGEISTAAVLPVQATTFTAEMTEALGLPDCVIGVTYTFESVPTDVEVSRRGEVYVSTLPGGPESPALGARGSVYKVNLHRGSSTLVATGFLGATNLALAPHGDIYVAELFAGKISVVHRGKVSTFAELPGVVAVETKGSTVWAATMGDQESQAPGTIVKITRRRS